MTGSTPSSSALPIWAPAVTPRWLQIAAEVLDCDLDNITVFGADTDTSPYDSGSYASSTTYVTGKAVEKCALRLRGQICKLGAELLQTTEDAVDFDGKFVSLNADPEKRVSL